VADADGDFSLQLFTDPAVGERCLAYTLLAEAGVVWRPGILPRTENLHLRAIAQLGDRQNLSAFNWAQVF
jgi:hypothetical protein